MKLGWLMEISETPVTMLLSRLNTLSSLDWLLIGIALIVMMVVLFQLVKVGTKATILALVFAGLGIGLMRLIVSK